MKYYLLVLICFVCFSISFIFLNRNNTNKKLDEIILKIDKIENKIDDGFNNNQLYHFENYKKNCIIEKKLDILLNVATNSYLKTEYIER